MNDAEVPPYLRLERALEVFASGSEKVQSQLHIKPLHQHFAIRLVIEGGFLPEEIVPHPPLRVEKGSRLVWDPAVADQREQTVLGGLKTKNIDIVVSKAGVGPVIGVSVKGTTGAFRNLTNRMEEAVGDSTNLHIMYPGLVYGFFHVIRANRAATADLKPNDIAVDQDGEIVHSLRRYHDVLFNLTGRTMVRDDPTRYESVALAMVDPDRQGCCMADFPPESSPLRVERFFEKLLFIYDLRFPYVAASVGSLRRREWSTDSPVFAAGGFEEAAGFAPRLAG